MTTNKEFIASALHQRLQDVRDRMASLGVEAVNVQLEIPESWKASSSGCLDSLRLLMLGKEIEVSDEEPAPAEVVLETLKSVARDSSRRFELLTQRYSYSLNFLNHSEDGIREHLLERLMVQDRAAIERSSVDAIDARELLLRLNLLSLYAAVSSDLRYLDALNYYFELLPSNWDLNVEQRELLNSFLVLYTKAMSDML